ncbi:MFS transporter [Nitratireductor aquibiodomus]|uniref:MFS transporter n=1 Tax=Nitratireductor aquibiodomus TaxID=204799 RepID=UPI002FDEBC56
MKAVPLMALFLVALGAPFLFRMQFPARERPHTPSLKAALRRPEIRKGLLAAGVYVLAQKGGMMMLGPLLVDAGLSLETIGLVNGLAGLSVGLVAALAGGALVRRLGPRPVLVLALALQSIALGFFSLYDFFPGLPNWLLACFAVASGSAIMALASWRSTLSSCAGLTFARVGSISRCFSRWMRASACLAVSWPDSFPAISAMARFSAWPRLSLSAPCPPWP